MCVKNYADSWFLVVLVWKQFLGGSIKKKKIKAVISFGDISAGWLLLQRPSHDRAANHIWSVIKNSHFHDLRSRSQQEDFFHLRRTSDFWRRAMWSIAHKMWANTRKGKGDSLVPQREGIRVPGHTRTLTWKGVTCPPTLWPQDNFLRVLSESEVSKEFHTSLQVVWPHRSSKCHLETLASAGSLSDVQKCPCKCPFDTHRNLFVGVSSESLVSGSFLKCFFGGRHAVHLTPLPYYGLNGQSKQPCRTRLGASHLPEKQEMDIAGVHVLAHYPNTSRPSPAF